MAEKSSKLVVGFILCTILGASLGYGMFWLFPPSGVVLLTRSVTSKTDASKNDYEMTVTGVPGMAMTVTTAGNSFLKVEFTSGAFFNFDTGYSGWLRFGINLTVDNLIIAQAYVVYFESTALTIPEFASENVDLHLVTGVLSAGNHLVDVKWVSLFNQTGNNMFAFSTGIIPNTRSLIVQEIRA